MSPTCATSSDFTFVRSKNIGRLSPPKHSSTLCCFICLSCGGEGEIRSPDSLSTMPDFESGVVSTTAVVTIICGASLLRCYLECHINLRNLVGAKAGERKAFGPCLLLYSGRFTL